jgi:hypothetical protein
MLGVLAVAAVAVGAASAAATPKGGPIALFATVPPTSTPGNIVLAGAIGDWGKVASVDKNGKPDENGNFVKVTLKQGRFEIDATALDKKMANPRPQVQSDVTCSIAASGSGPVKLFDGTGLYQGISGTANVTMTSTGVGGRYHSGAKKGQCEPVRAGERGSARDARLGHRPRQRPVRLRPALFGTPLLALGGRAPVDPLRIGSMEEPARGVSLLDGSGGQRLRWAVVRRARRP